MKIRRTLFLLALVCVPVLAGALSARKPNPNPAPTPGLNPAPAAVVAPGPVYQIAIDGIIDPAVEDYVKTSLHKAELERAECLIITLDTPGGMLDAAKGIVQSMLGAKVPVAVFVSPRGASATSAGMMLTVGAHVAVMAPGTNIGAAHPVMMPFGIKYEPIAKDDVMMEKATEDTAAWVRSVAEVRGRNAEWVVKAVKESASITASEAKDKSVVDGIAQDLPDLMKFLNGREVKLTDHTVTLRTAGATPGEISMSVPQRLQHFLNNPNVILILLLLGALGIAIEFKSPGLIFPGVLGGACILLALVAPQLPVNYIGLLLIVLAFVFLIAELFIVSHGLLTAAAVISLVVGALMLFKTEGVSNVQVSLSLLIPLVVFVVSVLLIFGTLILKAHRAKVLSGAEEMVDMTAVAESDLTPTGKIFFHGEYWNAIAEAGAEIKQGDRVRVTAVDNLTCKVRKA